MKYTTLASGILNHIAPRAYECAVRLRHSHPIRLVEGYRNRARLRAAVAGGQSINVDISGKMGFGATLTNATMLYSYCDAVGLRANIVSSNPLYTTDTDFFLTYFQRTRPVHEAHDLLIYRFEEDVTSASLAPEMTVEKAHDIFFSRFEVKHRYLAEAKAFAIAIGEPYISVHFRGSDKRIEAARVDWGTILNATKKAIRATGIEKIFVASDEKDFLDYMAAQIGERHIVTYECKYMASGSIGAHIANGDPLQKGREALVTMLILSMSHLCIRGSSHMSAWAKILSPALPIVMLNGEVYGRHEYIEHDIIKNRSSLIS